VSPFYSFTRRPGKTVKRKRARVYEKERGRPVLCRNYSNIEEAHMVASSTIKNHLLCLSSRAGSTTVECKDYLIRMKARSSRGAYIRFYRMILLAKDAEESEMQNFFHANAANPSFQTQN
jgi:hypothetical protein